MHSINDGFLLTEQPLKTAASDAYTVDYSTTTGSSSRWSAINWPGEYPNMRGNDERALTYTTEPLVADVEVTGHPVAHLWLTTEAPDLDVFVYLEEVDSRGNSTYVTEGALRASHRTTSKAPFDNLGLPYYGHFESELTPVPSGEPVELAVPLLATAHHFREGNRMRITIACADADNFETPVLDPAPGLRLLRDANHPSLIDLPVRR